MVSGFIFGIGFALLKCLIVIFLPIIIVCFAIAGLKVLLEDFTSYKNTTLDEDRGYFGNGTTYHPEEEDPEGRKDLGEDSIYSHGNIIIFDKHGRSRGTSYGDESDVITHFDRHGEYAGKTFQQDSASAVSFDQNGEFTGGSSADARGIRKHYDQYGNVTGTSIVGEDGHVVSYDEHGNPIGESFET